MPLVPADHVHAAFERASAALIEEKDDADVLQFLSYYEKTWTGYTERKRFRPPRYPISLWNVFDLTMDGDPRTNNRTEAWHRSLRTCVRISHPPFYHIVEELKNQEKMAFTLRNQLLSGQSVYQRPDHRAKDERIKNVANNFGSLDILDYLKLIFSACE